MFKNKVLLYLVVSLMPFVLFAQTSASDMVAQMGRGINLGNVLSAPTEGNWSPIVRSNISLMLPPLVLPMLEFQLIFLGLELQVILPVIQVRLELQEIILEHRMIT